MNRYTQGSLPVDCGHWGFNGFSVTLSGPVLWAPHSIMRRFVTLVNQVALATTDSAGLQAQMVGANQAATRYQAENLQLKQVWSIPEITLQTKPQIMVLHRSYCIPASFRSMDFLSIRCWATPEPIQSKSAGEFWVFTYLLHLHLYSISQHFDTSRSVSKTNRPVHSIPLFSLQVYLLCGEKGPANLKVLSSV